MSSAPLKRIGILSGGGDCPGINAVIRAVAKTAMFQHGLEVYGIEDGFLGLIENRVRRLEPKDVSNILTRGGTILGTTNKADPSRYCVGRDDQDNVIWADVSDKVAQHAASHQLDAIVCIGGDGTMTAAAGVARRGVRFVGVPKTIDNDLADCELTFGFQTAVQTATEALDRIHTTAASHNRIMLVEMMGRNAGWLTLHAGIAGGADVILIPEIPFSLDAVCAFSGKRMRGGKTSTIIAVAEGTRASDADTVVHRIIADSPDPIRYGGVSQLLCKLMEERTGFECRATVLGHVQRGGTPVADDRVLGTLFGHKAMELVMSGQLNQVVVMRDAAITSVPLSTVAGKQRTIPLNHPLIRAARAVGTSFGEG